MADFTADEFYMIARVIESGMAAARIQPEEKEVPDTTPDVAKTLLLMARSCGKIGLRVSAKCALDLAKSMATGKMKWGELRRGYETLHGRIQDEMGLELFFHVPSEYAKYYNSTEGIFGSDVLDKFPSAVYDISESGKCLAFERSTASVFHLMRVMESGLKSLARGLDIPYAPSWESYLSQIQGRIDAKHKKKGIRWKKDEPYFKEIAGDLIAVKTCWRNPTMHIDRVYTLEEAQNILYAVKTFMQRLAPRFSEIRTK